MHGILRVNYMHVRALFLLVAKEGMQTYACTLILGDASLVTPWASVEGSNFKFSL